MEGKPDRKKVFSAVEEVLRENFVNEPPVSLTQILRNYGLSWRYDNLNASGFKQVAGFIDPLKKEIVVNEADKGPISHREFTLAHELGHWLLHRTELQQYPDRYAVLYYTPLGQMNNDPVEVEANLFAAHLLVPEHLLKQFENESISRCARIFGVPEELIAFRRNAYYAT